MVASGNDIRNIFSSLQKKHMIVYRDGTNGHIGGYLILKKRKWKDDFDDREKRAEGVHKYIANLEKANIPGIKSPFYFGAKKLQKGYDTALKVAAEDVGFRYKYVPARGYEFDIEKGLIKKVESKRRPNISPIEQMALVTSIMSLSFLVVYLSFSMTGNTIADLSQILSNRIEAILFLIGLVSAFFYFEAKRKTSRAVPHPKIVLHK